MLKLLEICDEIEVQSDVLRKRLISQNNRTLQFVVLNDEAEAGLLIYEDSPELYDSGHVREIFILECNRRTGIGAYLLAQAEKIAVRRGRKSIWLTAYSLCRDQLSNAELIGWYQRKGYILRPDSECELEKSFPD